MDWIGLDWDCEKVMFYKYSSCAAMKFAVMSLKMKGIYRMLLFLLYAVSFFPLLSINETIRTHTYSAGRFGWSEILVPLEDIVVGKPQHLSCLSLSTYKVGFPTCYLHPFTHPSIVPPQPQLQAGGVFFFVCKKEFC